jgi:hypothetical protein
MPRFGTSESDRDTGNRRRRIRAACMVMGLLAAASCGNPSDSQVNNGGQDEPTTTNTPTGATDPTATSPSPGGVQTVVTAADFNESEFSASTTIDNQWLPLQPGMQFVFKGAADIDGERQPARDVFTVTDLTKIVDGVRTVVVWDRDYSNGRLVEAELALFAQDDSGNVWLLGEYPEEYDGGEVVDIPTWISGLQEARAGIAMPALPALGTPSYAAGWAPAVEFTDRARVHRVGVETCVPSGCYHNVIVIDEFNPDEPGSHQLKYYAPNIGNVRVGWAGARDESKEILKLINRVQLSDREVAAARSGALALEQRAYRFSPDVYAKTPRAVPTG